MCVRVRTSSPDGRGKRLEMGACVRLREDAVGGVTGGLLLKTRFSAVERMELGGGGGGRLLSVFTLNLKFESRP